jgi:shikimate dehydrogenase
LTNPPPPYSLGLTGWPLGHSLSPRLHNAALAALGLAGEYLLYPAEPLPDGAAALAELAERLRAGSLHGLNVTIPHKQSVLPLVDALSPAAQAVGAANTLLMREGCLLAENTDVPGFLADLQAQFGQSLFQTAGRALVIGAGGSARAVVYALAQAGRLVSVAARRLEQAQALIAGFQGLPEDSLEAIGLDLSAWEGLAQTGLIVNTTPLGMSPNSDASPWPDGLPFPRAAAVYDLVYNPRETAFLHAARRAGLPAANGLGMLVEQAALSLELWTARPAPREVMYNAVGEE